MLKKLEAVKNASHKSLDIQNSDLAFLKSKLKSCQEFVSNLMDNGSANEIFSFKRQIADRVTELTVYWNKPHYSWCVLLTVLCGVLTVPSLSPCVSQCVTCSVLLTHPTVS